MSEIDGSMLPTRYDTMRQAIISAKNIDDVKEIRDKAEALRQYAKQAGESLENQNMIAEIKLRAERRAGELSRELPIVPGKRTDITSVHAEPRLQTKAEALQAADISATQAKRFEAVASLPEKVFEAHIIEVKAKNMELTSAGMMKVAQEMRQEHRQEQKREVAQTLPETVYNVIYADPPWEYSNTGLNGAAEKHYPTMSLDKLFRLPLDINLHISSNAVLFLWATNPLLEDALELVRAWGFSYKTNIVWIKSRVGTGFYVRGLHELLMIATKGSFTPLETNHTPPITSVLDSPAQEHSRKPDEVYEIIEGLYPGCSYIELFSRRKREGWVSHGNEIAD